MRYAGCGSHVDGAIEGGRERVARGGHYQVARVLTGDGYLQFNGELALVEQFLGHVVLLVGHYARRLVERGDEHVACVNLVERVNASIVVDHVVELVGSRPSLPAVVRRDGAGCVVRVGAIVVLQRDASAGHGGHRRVEVVLVALYVSAGELDSLVLPEEVEIVVEG